MNLLIAGNHLSLSDATSILADYANNHGATLGRYDGRAHEPLTRWKKFTPKDIDAARVIERRAIHPAVAEGILAAKLPWNDVPDRSVDLADVGPASHAYNELAAFYLALRQVRGVGPAVATKMMYLRWPAATPIQDSLLMALYEKQAAAKYEELRAAGGLPAIVTTNSWRRLYSFAVRDDLITNRRSSALEALRNACKATLSASAFARVNTLSDCRIIDILAWSLAKRG